MMFIILDKNPIKAVDKLPHSVRFKQLIELTQLLSSCGVTDVYKSIPQGKELQKWILKHLDYIWFYYSNLYYWCTKNIKLSDKTNMDIRRVLGDLWDKQSFNENGLVEHDPQTIVFRYSKDYTNTNIQSKTLLPIDLGIQEYEKYTQWKINNGVWRY